MPFKRFIEIQNEEDGLLWYPLGVQHWKPPPGEASGLFVDDLQQEPVAAGVLPAGAQGARTRAAGYVPVTYVDVIALEQDFSFRPSTSLREVLRRLLYYIEENRG